MPSDSARAGIASQLQPTENAPQEVTVGQPTADRQREEHDLPDGFLARMRVLLAHSMMHVPWPFHQQLCEVITACLEGCNVGEESAAILEQARSNLFLGHISKGGSALFEVRTRLELW